MREGEDEKREGRKGGGWMGGTRGAEGKGREGGMRIRKE